MSQIVAGSRTDVLAKLALEQRGHSIFAPSSAEMWLNCPGSLVANALAPDKSSFESAEGTVAHMVGDTWLRSGKRPAHLLKTIVQQEGFPILIDEAMLAYVGEYVDWVRETPGDQYYEQRVDLSPIMPIPNQGGTADHFALTFGKMVITDLKYGRGIKVDAQGNKQALLYAYGVFLLWDWYYDFQTIEIRICQPRLEHFDTWTIDRASLIAFADLVEVMAPNAWALDAPRKPTVKGCQWCKVQANCPAFLDWFHDDEGVFTVEQMAEAAETASDMLSFDDPFYLPALSIEACARILPMRGAVEKWFQAIENRLFNHALDDDVPGWKIVEGRSDRKWIDEAAAKKRMIEVGIPISETETRKLKSPNQVEETLHANMKMPKKKARQLFESHTVRSEGVRTLVRADDKRPALERDGDVFEDLTGDL